MVLGEKRERGFGLHHANGAWRLVIGKSAADAAEVVDVTGGAPGMKWQVSVQAGALSLGGDRFAPGHAYRVELRQGTRSLGSALVYLYPPKVSARHKVQFDEADLLSDGEMATLPKPTL